MGCTCTEPQMKPSDFEMKDSGKPGEENSLKKNSSTDDPSLYNSLQIEPSDSISQNLQKLEKCSPENVWFTNCATTGRNQGIKSSSEHLKQYCVDSVAELSDLPSAKSRKKKWVITKTTSSNINGISLGIQQEVILLKCIPEEGSSSMIEQDRVVHSEVSSPTLHALESTESSTVELSEVTKELDLM